MQQVDIVSGLSGFIFIYLFICHQMMIYFGDVSHDGISKWPNAG